MNSNPVYVPNNNEIQKFQIFMHKNTGKYCLAKDMLMRFIILK